MNPLRYRRPTLVHPPFRDALQEALLRQAGPEALQAAERLLPLLDGARSVADVHGAMVGHGFGPGLITDVLGVLARLGCLADADDEGLRSALDEVSGERPGVLAWLEAWLQARPNTVDAAGAAHAAQAALATARVVVMGLGRVGSALVEHLAMSGVGVVRGLRSGDGLPLEASLADGLAARVAMLNPGIDYQEISAASGAGGAADLMLGGDGGVPLLVYCPDVHREEVCLELNRMSLDLGASLLPYRETAFHVELGPMVMPGRTACHECYRIRRLAAEPGSPAADEASTGALPALPGFSVGASLLAMEVIKVLTRAAFPACQGKLWRLGLFDGSASVHPVLKLPRCPACGVHRSGPPRRLWEE